MSFILIRRMSLRGPIMKKRTLLYEFAFVLIGKQTLILKSGEKKSFYIETKASMSFIPTSRMSLWCPILKWKEIIMWIHAYPNEENMFMAPNHEMKGDYNVNPCLPKSTDEY